MKVLIAVLIVIVGVIGGYIAGTKHSLVESSLGLGVNSLKTPATPTVQSVELKIETKSPDTAVKSWWSFLDYKNNVEVDYCVKHMQDGKDIEEQTYKYIQKITNGALLAYKTPIPRKSSGCSGSKFTREITEVKTETETRAVVYATVKNADPIPEGAQPKKDELHDELKDRENGRNFKYVLEKDSGGWKIVQVYKYPDESEIKMNRMLEKDNSWNALYEVSTKAPYYPSDVYWQ